MLIYSSENHFNGTFRGCNDINRFAIVAKNDIFDICQTKNKEYILDDIVTKNRYAKSAHINLIFRISNKVLTSE